MRQIAVIGLGNFGSAFAKRCQEQGNEVLGIDSRKDVVQELGEQLSKVVHADGRDMRLLKDLGLSDYDLAVVSFGQSIEASTLTTLHLKSLGVKEIYVKAISDDHARILELVGATRVIYPEREMAEKLAMSVSRPNIVDYLPLMDGFTLLEIRSPRDFHGRNLVELDLRRRFGITVIAIHKRITKMKFLAPGPSYTIGEEDDMVLLGETTDVQRFQSSLQEE
jgi:trk system potassium uptake protein TrkA